MHALLLRKVGPLHPRYHFLTHCYWVVTAVNPYIHPSISMQRVILVLTSVTWWWAGELMVAVATHALPAVPFLLTKNKHRFPILLL
jgi:hypothetical protein